MELKPVSDSVAVLVHWMGIADINGAGFVHGGVVMKLCDEVAGLSAIRYSNRRVVTGGVDRMTFLEPIEQNEVVTFTASVNAVWRTSMEVGVKVTAEKLRSGQGPRHTSTAYFTMVALDADAQPTAIPGLQTVTEDEQRRERDAQTRRANRLAERETAKSQTDGGA
jgi:acyl-CoA hydrolase